MIRQVQAPDGRLWTVRRQMNWLSPAVGEEFEHDVAPGYLPGVVLMMVLALLVVVLVAWTPDSVIVPGWLVLLIVLLLLVLPARWALRRPWTLVAEVPDEEYENNIAERWVGTVDGVLKARSATSKVVAHISLRSEPDIEGPLAPVE
jgi:uncharacterized protein (DUF983 family)